MRSYPIWLALAFLLGAGCAGEEPSENCDPGDTMSCTCTGGASGTRTCESDGTFGDCNCQANNDCSADNPGGDCPLGSSCVDGMCCANQRACGSRCCSSGQQCMSGICASPCGSVDPNGFCEGSLVCVNGSCCPAERACTTTCCPPGETCSGGSCMAPVCSDMNPTGTCEDGATCIDGACCPQGRVCGSTCCTTAQTCNQGTCMGVCQPDCAGKTCGPNGCGGMCGPGCATGFTCAAGSCTLEGNRVWQVKATTGAVAMMKPNGDNWDGGIGSVVAPDPLVCATVNAGERCTAAIDNTHTPDWGGTLIAEATASRLQAGIMTSYRDEDLALDDVICELTVTFGLAVFQAGAGSVTCPNSEGQSLWRFTLTPKP